ncbi:MAG: phage portal protein [Planctomycetia bacterium]|nr:phage portal protein [Planctomycetia bacterium]
MVAQNISSAEVGDMKNNVTDYSVDTLITDGATGQNETTWVNTNFSQYLGYYKKIPELKSTIDTKAKWVIGKGYTADEKTKKIMDKWRGWGKDTPNVLIKNMSIVCDVGGDFFAEIIRDENIFKKIFTWFGFVEKGKPINLKPLDPASIKIVVNSAGMLERYEQISKIKGEQNKIIKSENMFHLPNNRFADEIHGISIITAIEEIILARNEAMADIKKVFHRYVQPFNIFKLDTDDPTKISAFIEKENARNKDNENMFLPMGTVEVERISMPQYSTLDPLPYISDLTDYFYQATNTPDVIVGSAKQTVEASAKILFLGYEQSVRDRQLFIMENFESQLGLKIKLKFPTPIEEELNKDEKKDGSKTKATQKNDTTAGSGK